MTLFLITFFVLLLAILAMSVGVMFSGRAIKGSCGGIANVPGMEDYNKNCSCSNPCEKRLARMEAEQKKEHTVTFKF